MANVLVERQYLQDIADSIRTKTGSIDTYTPAQMAQAINSIGNQRVIEDKQITYGMLDVKYMSDFIINGGIKVNHYNCQSVGITQPDLTQFSNPCYLFEAILNFTSYDDSWSGLVSLGGSRSSGGVLFVCSHNYVHYRNGGRDGTIEFGDTRGDFHFSLVAWADKSILYKNKVKVGEISTGNLYNAFSGRESFFVGTNEYSPSEYFKGIIKKMSLKVMDLSSGTDPLQADYDL